MLLNKGKHCKDKLLTRFQHQQLLHPFHTQNYRLVLTGHSLGAGVASLLAIVLKPKYPKLQCYAYSPPGCVIRYSVLCVLLATNVFCFGSAQSVKARMCIALVYLLQCGLMLSRENSFNDAKIIDNIFLGSVLHKEVK